MSNNNRISSFSSTFRQNNLSIPCRIDRSPLNTCNIYPLMRSKSEIPSTKIRSSPHHSINLTITRKILIFQIICLFYTRKINFTKSSCLSTEISFDLFHRVGPSKTFSTSSNKKRNQENKNSFHFV